MDPSSPATPPATKQDQPSPTLADEDEVVASLLLLKEAAGPEEDIDLDKENHLIPDESTVEVNMNVEKQAWDKQTALVTSSIVDEFSADEALGEEEKNESLKQEEKYEALEHEGDDDNDDDDDDDLDEEEVEEYDCPAVVSTEEVRRCNRNNGRGWICNELAEPGFATCLPHIQSRRDNYHKFLLRKLQGRKLQGSTSRSETTIEPKIEDAATSGVGDQDEAAGPSSPGTLAGAK